MTTCYASFPVQNNGDFDQISITPETRSCAMPLCTTAHMALSEARLRERPNHIGSIRSPPLTD